MNKGLTSFRFFAFFAVFVFHAHHFRAGYLGVSAFFVLSGFLITDILVNMKDSFSGKAYFINFYARRTLRIFPLYYLYLVLVCILAWHWRDDVSQPYVISFYHQLPWSLSYTYNFLMASDSWQHSRLISHFWSLAVEEQFYLIWPIFIYFLPARYLKNALLCIILLGPVFRWLTAALVYQHSLPFFGERTDLVINVLPFSHIDAFAIGGFFSLYIHQIKQSQIFGLTALIIFVGLVTSKIITGDSYWTGLGYNFFMSDSYKYIWGYTAFNLLFACMLVAIRNRNFLPGIMESNTIVFLGTISYGLYVYHEAALWLTGFLFNKRDTFAAISLAFAVTLGISSASYYFFELPISNFKEKLFPKIKVRTT